MTDFYAIAGTMFLGAALNFLMISISRARVAVPSPRKKQRRRCD
ncbi:MAG TPA: hypothetical protein VFI23_11120 [Rhizomicrobium sp.]|nr:hypothetical protein [Rhizomicrobium sp.]